MTRPPIRLLEGTEASAAERALLEAGRSVPVVRYDVAAGAAKLQAALQGASTAAPATTTALAKTATLSKLAVLLVPTLGAVAAYYVMRSEPQHADHARVPVMVEPPSEANTPSRTTAVVDVAPHTAATEDSEIEDAPATPRDGVKVERTRAMRRAAHAPSSTSNITTQAHETVTAAAPTAAMAVPHEAEPLDEPEEVAALEEPSKPEAPAPTVAPDSINELRGIAAARALIERDPAQALAILQRLSRVHPQGYFVEERAALTVLALSGSDNEDEARKHAARFLKTYPTSPFADRVRNAVR